VQIIVIDLRPKCNPKTAGKNLSASDGQNSWIKWQLRTAFISFKLFTTFYLFGRSGLNKNGPRLSFVPYILAETDALNRPQEASLLSMKMVRNFICHLFVSKLCNANYIELTVGTSLKKQTPILFRETLTRCEHYLRNPGVNPTIVIAL
jgi:hypothetical protein